MFTTTIEPVYCTQASGVRRSAGRLVLVCAGVLASVAFVLTGPAQARIESPWDAGVQESDAVAAAVSPGRVKQTRVTGLYGVKVKGGWLLR